MTGQNPDGTTNAQIMKQYPDGTLSNVKNSTLAPSNWSNEKIIQATEQVGDTLAGDPAVGRLHPAHGPGRRRELGYD